MILTVGFLNGTPAKAHDQVSSSIQFIPTTLNQLLLPSTEDITKYQVKIALQPLPAPTPVVEPAPAVEVTVAVKRTVKPTVSSGTYYGGNVIVLDSDKTAYYNCVSTVRLFHSYPQGGNPRATPQFINSKQPSVGAVAVQRNHVMIVVSYTNTSLVIKEGNFIPGKLTERVIPRSSVEGYYR